MLSYSIHLRKHLIYIFCLLFFISCDEQKKETPKRPKVQQSKSKEFTLFELLKPNQTGIGFQNMLTENQHFNSFSYDYFYNGGGVATADFDNDGNLDLFFTGNMSDNKVYKNLGNWKFRDMSDIANIKATNTWCSGVTTVDINGDGLQDIYVCRTFPSGKKERFRNLFYINKGDWKFEERAAEFGIDDDGYSTQASFFDYDLDGDLDLLVANHPVNFHPETALERFNYWKSPNLEESNHLYENNGDGTFKDVTEKAGLLSYDFTLGIITADFNGDLLPDIYLSNDYELPDRYYINNGDGTFKKSLKNSFRHTSNFSMGIDYADINNDSLADLVAVDMVAEDNYRSKTMMPSMDPASFWTYVNIGYHFQYMRNSLQLNRGDNTFAEIGQMAGIAKTDWSWAVLLADFNLDGWKDMYITNGYYRDTRNVDYRNFYEANYGEIQLTNEQIQEILKKIPRQKINNYYFENDGNLHFNKKSRESGIKHPSYSNGAVYADLDNDGDLDLVVNNLGEPAFVYQNQSIENQAGNYLVIELIGEGKNLNGIGAKVSIRTNDEKQFRQQINSRGYQSAVSNRIHFGIGKNEIIDEIVVDWPSGKRQRVGNVKPNQRIELRESYANEKVRIGSNRKAPLFARIKNGIDFRHRENIYDDYAKEILLPHSMSQMGPKMSVGDVNGDQLDDVFIGAATGLNGKLFIQQSNGEFSPSASNPWDQDQVHEDIGNTFFDADQDGDLDLYVISGSNEQEANSSYYMDRLYLNDGKGNFSKSHGLLPEIYSSGSCVLAEDYDQDGDLDLFVGGRQIPAKYPFPASSYLLKNNNGKFEDVSQKVLPELSEIGLVSTAIWTDYDNDQDKDLILAGEWMPIRLFENDNGEFKEQSESKGLDSTNGWWNTIVECDLNKDGLKDYVLGNLGLNYKYKASKTYPFPVYVNDFDQNGTQDIVLSYSYKGQYFPVRGRECSSQQMPDIKKRFPTYHAFGQAKLEDIYGEGLKDALHYEVYGFASVILKNTGDGFDIISLPIEAQFSAIQGIVIEDFTKDGKEDILVAGNFFVSEVETGRADASTGLLLKNNGDFNFEVLSNKDCGFFAPSDVRDLQLIKSANNDAKIAVANNNGPIQLFDWNP